MKPESTTPQPAAPAPTTKQIKKDITYAYNEHGQSSAFDVANSYGVGYEYCKGCETDSPSIEHECLICGQTNAPAPISREVEGFTPGEWEAKYNTELFPGQAAIYGNDGDENGRVIAVMDTSDETDTANIDLVCSAPTLYRENQQLTRLKNEAWEREDKLVKAWEQQAKDIELLREALQLLTNNINLSKLNIRKDFSLINAHANGLKALKQTEPKQ